MSALTLFYDGHCALCTAEMARLRRWNGKGRLTFVDIAAPGFSADVLGVERGLLDIEMHSLRADGVVLVGIDSILAAYTLVGRGWLVLPLRVRPLRPLFGALYRALARNRYRISSWLGYAPVCRDGVCERKNPFN